MEIGYIVSTGILIVQPLKYISIKYLMRISWEIFIFLLSPPLSLQSICITFAMIQVT